MAAHTHTPVASTQWHGRQFSILFTVSATQGTCGSGGPCVAAFAPRREHAQGTARPSLLVVLPQSLQTVFLLTPAHARPHVAPAQLQARSKQAQTWLCGTALFAQMGMSMDDEHDDRPDAERVEMANRALGELSSSSCLSLPQLHVPTA